MRKSGLLLLFLVLLAGWALFVTSRGSEPALSPLKQEQASEPGRTAVLEGEASTELAVEPLVEGDSEPLRSSLAAEEPEEPSVGELPRMRVLGRTVDSEGRPLAGVKLRMDSVGERWLSLEKHPEEIPRIEAVSDSDGGFVIEAPLPSSDWVALRVTPDEFHGEVGREFGRAGGRDGPPLLEGDNDLGTLTLTDAGAFEGVVLDEDGRPVEGVRVSLSGSFPGGYVVAASTRADGTYRVGHVPAGRYDVETKKRGYLTARRRGVHVQNGAVETGIDLTVEVAPEISGRVTDEEGRPLENVRLYSWPSKGGRGARARSAADGTFTTPLPQAEPYTLEATHPGYEKFDPGRQVTYAPGTTDIEVVLKRAHLVRFRVLDAVTGEPVERFGLKCRERNSTSWRGAAFGKNLRRLSVQDYAGGEAQVPGTPRSQEFQIRAPGYAPQTGLVEAESEGVEGQTIRLQPGASIRGRFMKGGQPLASPTLRLVPESIALREGATEDRDDPFSNDWGRDVAVWVEDQKFPRGEEDGRFEVSDLASGTYKLTLTAQGVPPVLVRDIRVTSGEATDLGVVESAPPSGIQGTLLVGHGLSANALRVLPGTILRGDETKAVITDSSGQFELLGLAEGRHYLWIEAKRGVLLEGEPIEVDLGPGEVRTIQIDLRDRLPCTLDLRAVLQGHEDERLHLSMIPDTNPATRRLLGTTDEEGRWSGESHPAERAFIDAFSERKIFVGRAPEMLFIPPAGQTSLEFELQVGELRLSFPLAEPNAAGEGWDPRCMLRSQEPRTVLPVPLQHLRLKVAEIQTDRGSRLIDLGVVAPGRYSITLDVGISKFVGTAEVRAGETTLAPLTEQN